MNTKVNEGKLISGKDALIALANGEDVEFLNKGDWGGVGEMIILKHFTQDSFKFRLKPRTITINSIEVPAPFEPCVEDDCRVYVIDTRNVNGYDWQHSSHCNPKHIVWRTEEEIKQVVSALRFVLTGGSHDN